MCEMIKSKSKERDDTILIRRVNWGISSCMEKPIVESKALLLLLLLLPLPGLMVLEPVKDIFALDVPIIPKPCSNLLNLFCSWGSQPILVQALEHVYLLLCWVPSRPSISKILIATLHSFLQENENGRWVFWEIGEKLDLDGERVYSV